jgi:hypothetical protein
MKSRIIAKNVSQDFGDRKEKGICEKFVWEICFLQMGKTYFEEFFRI